MTKYRCENCRHFGNIVGLTDADGKPHYKPSVCWGACTKHKTHKFVNKAFSCRYFEKRKEQK